MALTQLAAPADACVTGCIDPANRNSVTETIAEPAIVYDVIYVHGVELSLYNPCESCDGAGPYSCLSCDTRHLRWCKVQRIQRTVQSDTLCYLRGEAGQATLV